MTRKMQTLGKIHNSIEKLYNKFQLKPFHTTEINDVIRSFRLSAVVSSSIKNSSFVVQYSKGMYVFVREPNMDDAKSVYSDTLNYYKNFNANKKKRQAEEAVTLWNEPPKIENNEDTPPPPTSDNSIFNELDAINLLKGLGYKIMKPVTQFEEI